MLSSLREISMYLFCLSSFFTFLLCFPWHSVRLVSSCGRGFAFFRLLFFLPFGCLPLRFVLLTLLFFSSALRSLAVPSPAARLSSFPSLFWRGHSLLFFASLFRGYPPFLPIANIPPCPVASFSFGYVRACFSASVPHAFRLLQLFPFSSCLLTCGLSTSFSAVAQVCFI